MRSLMVGADWEPQKGFVPTSQDAERRLARNGNLVWKNPCFRVVDLPKPSVGQDEVLIRVRACGVCGSDVHMYEKDDDPSRGLHGIPRHDAHPGRYGARVLRRRRSGTWGPGLLRRDSLMRGVLRLPCRPVQLLRASR
jgi:hypothetical protein